MAGVALNSSSRRATRLLRKTKRADGYAPPQEDKKRGWLRAPQEDKKRGWLRAPQEEKKGGCSE